MTSSDDANLHAAAAWLAHSIDVCGGAGSSVCFSYLRGWYPPYPETTGYIIPTFYEYGHRFGRGEYIDRATRMTEWLLSLQFKEGGFPASHVDGKPKPPSVFNSGQILFGLLAAHKETGQQRFLDSAARAAAWLASEQDADGLWRKHAYYAGFAPIPGLGLLTRRWRKSTSFPGYAPSYHTRVCWPMLMTADLTGDDRVRAAAVRTLQIIAARQHANGVIADWGFAPGRPAFTHTIAYTIRGLLESADLLDDRSGLGETAVRAAMKLLHLFEVKKRLAGSYNEQWQGNYKYTCLTGNVQLAVCWMRIFDWTGDLRLVNAACKAIDAVTGAQRLSRVTPKAVRGAVPGSAPIWGRYLTLRYPNWAAKFLMDAIMYRNERLVAIRGAGLPA